MFLHGEIISLHCTESIHSLYMIVSSEEMTEKYISYRADPDVCKTNNHIPIFPKDFDSVTWNHGFLLKTLQNDRNAQPCMYISIFRLIDGIERDVGKCTVIIDTSSNETEDHIPIELRMGPGKTTSGKLHVRYFVSYKL
jgi:hypothetical protein